LSFDSAGQAKAIINGSWDTLEELEQQIEAAIFMAWTAGRSVKGRKPAAVRRDGVLGTKPHHARLGNLGPSVDSGA